MQTYDQTSYASRERQKTTIYQDDGRLFHRAGFTYAVVLSLSEVHSAAGVFSATAHLSDGTKGLLRLIRVGETILRLQFAAPKTDFANDSPMLQQSLHPTGDFITTIASSHTILQFNGYRVKIGLEPFSLVIADSTGRVILQLETENVAGDYITPPLGFRISESGTQPFLSWRIQNADHFFGLGEKYNKVEKSSTRATIWASDTCGTNTTDLSYKSVPLLHCTAGWSLLLHSTYRSFWEIGTFSYTSGSCLTEDPKLDAVMLLAPTLKQSVEVYSGLTGRTAMPPPWAFGLWMSRCAYENRAQVETVICHLRSERIPCDVIHIDPSWMRTHYYFQLGVDACDFDLNTDAWPDFRNMLAHWRSMGISTSLWVNPYLPEGKPIYEEAKSKGYLLRSSRGGTARLEFGAPVGIIDFTNPAAKRWWQDKLGVLMADGAATFKPDYGDRVPDDAIAFDGETGRQLHNIYLHLYCEAVAEAVFQATREHIIWRRGGYVGTQRFPGTWAGDTQTSWEGMRGALRGGLSAGFGGEACWSHDIGGFVGEKPSAELYIRWAEWGLLSPFARFHGTSPKEPWNYGSLAVEVVRHYACLRYTLIPYLLQCVRESSQTGIPIMRHLAMECPDDSGVYSIDDEYLLGPSLLVAPILMEGQREREVYLPTGEWSLFEEPSRPYTGGRYHCVAAPLERIPLFVRRRAILPRFEIPPQNLKGPLPPVIAWSAP